MHEYSITTSIIEILERLLREKGLSRIEQVDFELSPLAAIEPLSIEFYYEFLTRDIPSLKDARLVFKKGRVKMECTGCRTSFFIEEDAGTGSSCPECKSNVIRFGSMDDVRIVSISGE